MCFVLFLEALQNLSYDLFIYTTMCNMCIYIYEFYSLVWRNCTYIYIIDLNIISVVTDLKCV